MVHVIDSSIRIIQKQKQKLFASINSDKRKQRKHGVGLRLIVSKMIAKQFEGDICYKYQKGSKFTFSFIIDYRPQDGIGTNFQNANQLSNRQFLEQNKRIHQLVGNTKKNRILVIDQQEVSLVRTKNLLVQVGINVNQSVDFCLTS